MRKAWIVSLALAALLAQTMVAQDAKTVVGNASKAMGVEGLNSIQYYGVAQNGNLGQNNNANQPWPMVYEATPGSPAGNVSPGNWLDWQRLSEGFESFAAWVYTTATLTGENEPELLTGQAVSSEFFPSLKVLPQLGRAFSPEDDTPSTTSQGANMSSRVVILSHGLWQRRFGGDSNIVGRKVELDAAMYEVIGVMPQGFYFLNPLVEFWVPFALDRRRDWRATSGRIMTVVGRLKPGVSMTTAQTEMRTIAGQLEQLYDFNKNSSVSVVPLREVLTGEIRPSLLALLGAVSVLLLIACFNVASMMLARSASRRREVAVRAAIGAGRGALVRQFLVESLLLAVLAGAAGVLVALWSTSALVALSPRNLVRVPEVPLDGRILMYTSIVSVLTGLIFGLAPALTATRGSLGEYLHSFGRSVTRSARIREWLVVAQVTMTVVLLCGAGLLVRSFNALNSVPTGLKSSDVLTMQITMPPARYDRDQQVDLVTRAVQRLQSLPGVQSAGATRSLPVIGPTAGTGIHVRGTPDRPMMERPMTRVRMSTPGYFAAVGVPIIRGRDFTWDDLRPDAEPVFIVNDAFAKAHLPGQDPIDVSIRVFMLSAQKCDDCHCDDRDRQDIVPDALPANRAFEFGVMGLQILNDRLHLAVDQSELLRQCRSEIGWFCRLRGFAPRLHSLARQLYCKLHPIHRR